MATDEQNVYITGHGLREWSTEATQKIIEGSLKQIMADNNALLRYTAAMASGDKNANKILSQAVTSIRENTKNDVKGDKKEQVQGNRIVNSQQKIASTSLASLSAVTGLGSTILDVERREKKRDDTYNSLISQNFSEDAANKGADRKMQMDLYKSLTLKMTAFGLGVKSLADMFAGAAEQGFAERFAMVAEMRQAGLLSGMEGAEAGFIQMSKTISDTNFTFGEATEFTKQFSKAVGVTGVKSALTFANTVARDGADGMGYMKKYALQFGQVSTIAGEYLDTLRISGQLRGMDDGKMRSGMSDFMSNVEMTSNVLKISMEDAADLMKKAFGPADVALLATLPAEQRDAIKEGFLAMGAQGNPMAETLAKRLAAGSRGAFLQTAEYQEMAGTAPGREVLNFVEQMAGQLENGDTESFQSALAQGFPELADRLVQMSAQGGVRVQLLSDPQLASMVGQIIEAAQTYGNAAKGTQMGTQQPGEQANIKQQIQIREALNLSETAMNLHMEAFIENVNEVSEANRKLANEMARVLGSYTGAVGIIADASTWIDILGKTIITTGADWLTKNQNLNEVVEGRINDQNAGGTPIEFDPSKIDKTIDNNLAYMETRFSKMQGMNSDDAKLEAKILSGELRDAIVMLKSVVESNIIAKKDEGTWQENKKLLVEYAEKLDKFTTELSSQ